MGDSAAAAPTNRNKPQVPMTPRTNAIATEIKACLPKMIAQATEDARDENGDRKENKKAKHDKKHKSDKTGKKEKEKKDKKHHKKDDKKRKQDKKVKDRRSSVSPGFFPCLTRLLFHPRRLRNGC